MAALSAEMDLKPKVRSHFVAAVNLHLVKQEYVMVLFGKVDQIVASRLVIMNAR